DQQGWSVRIQCEVHWGPILDSRAIMRSRRPFLPHQTVSGAPKSRVAVWYLVYGFRQVFFECLPCESGGAPYHERGIASAPGTAVRRDRIAPLRTGWQHHRNVPFTAYERGGAGFP